MSKLNSSVGDMLPNFFKLLIKNLLSIILIIVSVGYYIFRYRIFHVGYRYYLKEYNLDSNIYPSKDYQEESLTLLSLDISFFFAFLLGVGLIIFRYLESNYVFGKPALPDNQLGKEQISHNITRLFGDNDPKNLRYNILSSEAEMYKTRLIAEIQNLSRRGSVNLAIGSAFALLPLLVLVRSIWSPSHFTAYTEILLFYLPRISIVLFTEIFSFFFLRIYRGSLIDIKYYQNELTSYEFKLLALKLSMLEEDKQLISNIAVELAKTERNPFAKVDEAITTTTTAKNENERDRYSLESLKEIFFMFSGSLTNQPKNDSH